MIDHVLSVVRLVCQAPEVWLSVGHMSRHPRLVGHLVHDPDVIFLEDDPGLDGPVAALVMALEHAERSGVPWVLATGCDMPMLRLQLLAAMIEAAQEAGPETSVIVPRVPGQMGARFEPLHALYRPSAAAGPMAALARGGQASMQRVLGQMDGVVALDVPELVQMDPQWQRSLVNINTLGELEALDD